MPLQYGSILKISVRSPEMKKNIVQWIYPPSHDLLILRSCIFFKNKVNLPWHYTANLKISILSGHISFFRWCMALGLFTFFSFLVKALIQKQNKKLIVSNDICCTSLIFLSILLILNFLRALFLLITLLLPFSLVACSIFANILLFKRYSHL